MARAGLQRRNKWQARRTLFNTVRSAGQIALKKIARRESVRISNDAPLPNCVMRLTREIMGIARRYRCPRDSQRIRNMK